jgi:hypothetical protein
MGILVSTRQKLGFPSLASRPQPQSSRNAVPKSEHFPAVSSVSSPSRSAAPLLPDLHLHLQRILIIRWDACHTHCEPTFNLVGQISVLTETRQSHSTRDRFTTFRSFFQSPVPHLVLTSRFPHSLTINPQPMATTDLSIAQSGPLLLRPEVHPPRRSFSSWLTAINIVL